MTKNVLQSIVGAEVYAIISLLLFVAVFVLMLFFVMRSSKEYINRMAALPLEDDEVLKGAIATEITK